MYTRWQKGLPPYHDTKEINSVKQASFSKQTLEFLTHEVRKHYSERMGGSTVKKNADIVCLGAFI